jgi:hypothetical protein
MKAITPILTVALAIVFCSGCAPRVETSSISTPNPTSYSFPFTVMELQQKAWQAFSIDHQVEQPIFGHQAGLGFESTLFAECATNAVFGEAVFRDPANAQDIYLHTFHTPFIVSPVYHTSQGGLPFIATFHLHLTASGTNTIVSVIASETEIINGTKFGFGPCGPGQGNVYVSVKPTTIEEYSILRYLGSYLGITNMPAVILPKS